MAQKLRSNIMYNVDVWMCDTMFEVDCEEVHMYVEVYKCIWP